MAEYEFGYYERLFDTLVPRVNASVPGCPYPTIFQHIHDAAIRACEKTLAWRHEIPLYNLLPGVHQYAYNKPLATDVHHIFRASINDRPLDIYTLPQALNKYPAWANLYSGEAARVVWELTPPINFNTAEYNEEQYNDGSPYIMPEEIVAQACEPRSICQLTPDKYIVLPLPDADKTYTMRMFVALKPKRGATGMETHIFDELEDLIFHNALQHLLVLPNVNWRDLDLASYHARQFTYQTAERRARANIGNVGALMRAQMQPFGA